MKPQKKFLKTSSSLCFLILLSGCLRPEKPVVEACQLDAIWNEGICGLTGQGANTGVTRKPIIEIDKSTCFPPKSWQSYKTYVDVLEAYATELEKNCK